MTQPLMQFRSDIRSPLRVAMSTAMRGADLPPEFDLQVRIVKGFRIISIYVPKKSQSDPAFT